jgi:hypothetical protein
VASKFGKTAPNMRAIGSMTVHTAKADSSIVMAMSMRDSGSMIKPMAKDSTNIWMAPSTRESGTKITSKDSELSPGPIRRNTLVITCSARSMERARSSGLTAQFSPANS